MHKCNIVFKLYKLNYLILVNKSSCSDQTTGVPNPSIKKHKIVFNPVTISDLSPSHFNTPENIKKYLNMIKSIFKKKCMENQNLKKTIKRLRKKVIAYQQLSI